MKHVVVENNISRLRWFLVLNFKKWGNFINGVTIEARRDWKRRTFIANSSGSVVWWAPKVSQLPRYFEEYLNYTRKLFQSVFFPRIRMFGHNVADPTFLDRVFISRYNELQAGSFIFFLYKILFKYLLVTLKIWQLLLKELPSFTVM